MRARAKPMSSSAPAVDLAASFDLSSLNGSNGFVLNGIDEDDFSGGSVSSAGDVNGDGFDDLIIGATFRRSRMGMPRRRRNLCHLWCQRWIWREPGSVIAQRQQWLRREWDRRR